MWRNLSENLKIIHDVAKEAFGFASRYIEETIISDILMPKKWCDKSARAQETGLGQKHKSFFLRIKFAVRK